MDLSPRLTPTVEHRPLPSPSIGAQAKPNGPKGKQCQKPQRWPIEGIHVKASQANRRQGEIHVRGSDPDVGLRGLMTG